MENKNRKKRVLRIRSIDINVKALIIVLLAVDLVIAGFVMYRNSHKPPKPEKLEPIVAKTPGPETDQTVLSHQEEEDPHPSAAFNVRYEKTAYKPEIDTSEGFTSTWKASGANEAYFDYRASFDTITAQMYNTGRSVSDASIFHDGISFAANSSPTVFLSVSSSGGGKMEIAAVNADTGEEYRRATLNLTPELTYYEFPFEVTSGTGNGRILMEFGGGAVPSDSLVTIYGLRAGTGDGTVNVRTNQIGYVSTDQKRCTFPADCGDLFDVVNAETGKIEFCGPIVYGRENSDTWETDFYGDFTNWNTPGTYFIRAQNGMISRNFVIDRDPYSDLRNAALRMLSYQRCGIELGEWAGSLSHAECHNRPVTLLYTDAQFDLSGGWHDAGDFGRYVNTGAKAVNDLMLAYMTAPTLFTDDTGSPDSGNGVPDILDEARYELEWLIKMQQDDGDVFCKVVTQSFPEDNITPDQDTQVLFVLASDTVSTADAAGSLAIGAIAFKDIDPEFAQRCLYCAGKSEMYLQRHWDMTQTLNPTDFSAGQYLDDHDLDARFTLEMAAYAATGDRQFLNNAKDIYEQDPDMVNGVSWNENGLYGAYLFLACSNGEKDDPQFYETMTSVLRTKADGIMEYGNNNSYNATNGLFVWGSNYLTANQGIILAMAYDFTGEQKYLQMAVEQLNYLLGKNSLDMCFVSGFGYNSPKSQHNRLAIAKNTLMTGAMSGGPDASREDNITKALPDIAPAKIYADDWRSYSTNEIAIYYNSALLYLMTAVY